MIKMNSQTAISSPAYVGHRQYAKWLSWLSTQSPYHLSLSPQARWMNYGDHSNTIIEFIS